MDERNLQNMGLNVSAATSSRETMKQTCGWRILACHISRHVLPLKSGKRIFNSIKHGWSRPAAEDSATSIRSNLFVSQSIISHTRGPRWAYIAHLINTSVMDRNMNWKFGKKVGQQCANKLLLKFDLLTYFLIRPYPYLNLSEILSI